LKNGVRGDEAHVSPRSELGDRAGGARRFGEGVEDPEPIRKGQHHHHREN
jgi:hypothetical protein